MGPNTPYTPSQSDNGAPPEWFTATPVLQQTPKHPRNRKQILIIVIMVGLTIVLTGLSIYARATATTCLTTDDYWNFYGTEPPEGTSFSQASPFFSGTYQFRSGSTSFDNSESESPDEDIKNLTDFHAAFPHKPLVFTITATEGTDEATKRLASERTATVKKLLVNAGIAPEAISTTLTSTAAVNSTDADTPAPSDSFMITMNSDPTCRP